LNDDSYDKNIVDFKTLSYIMTFIKVWFLSISRSSAQLQSTGVVWKDADIFPQIPKGKK